MTDQPKRRGRPPKDRTTAALLAEQAEPHPTPRLRHKAGVGVQQAWQHAHGTQWRSLPVVAADAPDWEDV